MIWSRERVIQGTRKTAYALAATTVCFVAHSQPALATQVQAYMLFDVAASSDAGRPPLPRAQPSRARCANSASAVVNTAAEMNLTARRSPGSRDSVRSAGNRTATMMA
jgi:hypothetical protein